MDVVARDGLACEVSLLRGELSVRRIARTDAAPPMHDARTGYSTRSYGGKLWRTYVLQQGPIRVATADRLDVREGLLRDVALTAAVPFAVALAGSLAMLWIGIGSGLAPLERLRRLLAARRPDEDAPLPAMRLPRELQPLAATVDHLLERVRGTLARERRFTDDAAHELRTPLTAVKTHLQVLRLALRDCPRSDEAADALDHADEGVLRMQRTMEQLLLLARLDGEARSAAAEPCDAAEVAAKAVREAESARGVRGRVLLRLPAAPGAAAVPEAMLVSAVRNILDNALRFAPEGSSVEVEVGVRDGVVTWTVSDRGPGLSEEQRALATRRFWRASQASAGSGLGLAITGAIARHYGGSLALGPRAGGGLQVTLALPAASQSSSGGSALARSNQYSTDTTSNAAAGPA
jgi:signal transduction histidine kinase